MDARSIPSFHLSESAHGIADGARHGLAPRSECSQNQSKPNTRQAPHIATAVRTTICLASLLLSYSAHAQQPKYAAFWRWFDAHSARLLAMQSSSDPILDSLSRALAKVDAGLTFEIGPPAPMREFVISADGVQSVFPGVEALAGAAPVLSHWRVTKFRPRRLTLNVLKLNGTSFDPARIHFLLTKDDPGKVGIVLFFDHYAASQHDMYARAGFLLLDEALGEYDMETRVGAIDFVGADSPHFSQSRPLGELARAFDSYFRRQSAIVLVILPPRALVVLTSRTRSPWPTLGARDLPRRRRHVAVATDRPPRLPSTI